MSLRDRGLQPERTVLAWQRTALSTVVAAAVVARLTVGVLGPLVFLTVGLCLAHSARLFVASMRNYATRTNSSLGLTKQPRDVGVDAILLCGEVLLLGLVEIIALVVSAGHTLSFPNL
jgi:uncharacterized membrane protein YidH (DUF202 family)